MHEENCFTTCEVAIYFYLLKVNNACNWMRFFKRNNAKIMADLGIKDRRTLENARNRLKQAGLIDYQKTTTSPNVIYSITCALNAEVSVQDTVQVDAQADVQDLYKLMHTKDKYKLKQNIPPIVPPKGDTSAIAPVANEQREELKPEEEQPGKEETGKAEPEEVKPESPKGKPEGKKKKPSPPLSKIEEEFEQFRKAYPGNKRGHKVEFDNFKKKHKDYQTAVYLLHPALMKLNAWRDEKKRLGQFVPEYANLSTWINQRRWEVEFEKIEKSNETERIYYKELD